VIAEPTLSWLLAEAVTALHLLWVALLVGGIFLARAWRPYLLVHWWNIGATVVFQVIWGACPLTLLEARARGGLSSGSFTTDLLSRLGVDVAPGFAPHLFILAVALTTVWATRARRKPAPRAPMRDDLLVYKETLATLATLAERALAFIQMRPGYADQVDFISEMTRAQLLKAEIRDVLEVVKQLQGEDDDG
jgi:hypothetical protein